MITIKSKREIEKIQRAGDILSRTHLMVKEALREGISTWEIDQMVEAFILKEGGVPSFKGYMGFPCSSCLSVNEVVIHGIASKHEILKNGDIISVDLGVYLDGYHSDAARTHIIGQTTEDVQKLVQVTKEAFFEGIKYAKPGMRVGDISHAVGKHADKYGFGIVRDFSGHGVSKKLHEEPMVFNYGPKGRGPLLQEGMVIAIEPMFNLGSDDVFIKEDGWTVVTQDGKPAAHYENTIVVTKDGAKILTNSFEE